jgi:hypothetical protein
MADRKLRRLTVAVVLTAGFILAVAGLAPALADDTAVQGVGGAIRPMNEHPSIVMEKMDVTIDLYPSQAKVECRFLFHNTGPAVAVRIGFPESGNQAQRGKLPAGFLTFSTTVDGKPVPTRIEGFSLNEATGTWQRWRVKAVRFAAGHTRRVTVRYTAPLGMWSVGPGRFFTYKVTTGDSWKGPIGNVHMLIRGHYSPDRAWLSAPSYFRRTGPTTFEWTARNLKPAEDVYLSYSLGADVRVAGETMEVGYQPPYPYVRDGEVWVPVQMLAGWLRADTDTTRSRVTLVKGDRSVTIRRGSKWLDENGHRVALRQSIRASHGALLAPLLSVARGLGATVAYDPTTRATDINFAFLNFLPKPGPGQRSPFTAMPEGFAPAELSEYDPTVLADLRKQGIAHPWVCLGDFNGDGFKDIALFVQKKSFATPDELGVLILPGDAFGWQDFSRLDGSPGVHRSAPGRLITVLHTHPPGEVAYYQEGETSAKSGRLQLPHDAVEVIAWGKATSLYYWDDAAKSYKSVITSD